jgi:FlaA1/EpsC-like NDP-sugar epimerase
MLTKKRVLITGGSGSLGKVLVRRLLTGELGKPKSITVFSRDEAKQNTMRLSYQHKESTTDEIIYRNFEEILQFQIGDVRDFHALSAVDTIFAAYLKANRGETYIPRVPSARMIDLAEAIIAGRPIKTVVTGIRPGEKVHEILVSEEEAHRTVKRGDHLAILPILPELRPTGSVEKTISAEYSSADNLITKVELAKLLKKHKLLVDDRSVFEEDLLV